MAEATSDRGVNWGSAIFAGLVATVVITITLALSGTNIMKMLGAMMLGAGASVTAQYTAGGLMHLPLDLAASLPQLVTTSLISIEVAARCSMCSAPTSLRGSVAGIGVFYTAAEEEGDDDTGRLQNR